jgi:hypothetical protein
MLPEDVSSAAVGPLNKHLDRRVDELQLQPELVHPSGGSCSDAYAETVLVADEIQSLNRSSVTRSWQRIKTRTGRAYQMEPARPASTAGAASNQIHSGST